MAPDIDKLVKELHPKSFELRQVVIELLRKLDLRSLVSVLIEASAHFDARTKEFDHLASELLNRNSVPGSDLRDALYRKMARTACVLLWLRREEEGLQVQILAPGQEKELGGLLPIAEWKPGEPAKEMVSRLGKNAFGNPPAHWESIGFWVENDRRHTTIYTIVAVKYFDEPENARWLEVNDLPDDCNPIFKRIVQIGVEWFVREW